MTEKKNEEYRVLKMIRYGIVLILLLYIGFLFASRGESNAPFISVEHAVVRAADDKEMTKGQTRDLKRLYGLNEKDYEAVSFYYTQATMGVNELLLIRVVDGQDSSEVEAAIRTRKETQLDNFEGYGAEQVKLLNNAVIKTRGNYVLFVVSPKAEEVEKAFIKSL